MELKSPFKLSLIFLLTAAPAMVLAQPSDCRLCNFNGWTVGLGLGASTFMTNNQSDTTLTSDHPSFVVPVPVLAPGIATPGNAVSSSQHGNIYRYGGMGTLYVGYGRELENHMFLGAELGLNVFGPTRTNSHGGSTTNTDVSYTDTEIGFLNEAIVNSSIDSQTKVTRHSFEPFLDVKLGWLMTPTALAYVKGGINYNTIKVKNNTSYTANGTVLIEEDSFPGNFPLTGTGSAGLDNSHSRTGVGYRAGIGMEVLITPELGVGADYVYTFYPKVTTSGGGTGTDVACDAFEGCQVVAANVSNTSKARVYDQQVMAQLIYHLG